MGDEERVVGVGKRGRRRKGGKSGLIKLWIPNCLTRVGDGGGTGLGGLGGAEKYPKDVDRDKQELL